MYRMNSSGPSTVPWGTPLSTFSGSDLLPLTMTNCCLLERKLSNHLRIFPEIPMDFSLHNNIVWSTLSNALLKSKYITSALDCFQVSLGFLKSDLRAEWYSFYQ